MADSNYDVIVIGAGITGLAAACSTARKGLKTASIEVSIFGGLVININELEGNVAGSGADLASSLMMEIAELGVESLSEKVTHILREADRLVVKTDAGSYCARAVIIASGATLKPLGVPGEAEFENKGISHCADCDGPLYRGQEVVVVGGGDSALQEALVLSRTCKLVYLVHRRESFRARQHFVDAVNACDNIIPVWGSVVETIIGGDSVEKIRVRNVDTSAVSHITCSGVFPYIGLQPACDFAPRELGRDATGFLITDPSLQTEMLGLFAAGAARAGYGGQLLHANAEGEAAGLAASLLLAVDSEVM